MWGFIHPNCRAGACGASVRGPQSLPRPSDCWALREAPTPGSASSPKRPKSSSGVRPQAVRPESATPVEQAKQARPRTAGSVCVRAPDHGDVRLIRESHSAVPAASPANRVPPVRQVTVLRRANSAPFVGSGRTSQAVSEAGTEAVSCTPGPRRSLAFRGGEASSRATSAGGVFTGSFGAGSDALPVTRRPPSRTPSRNINDRVAIGPVGALEVDRNYQLQLLEKWRRDAADDNASARSQLQLAQLHQFFDFLRGPREDSLVPGAARYIQEVFPGVESVEDFESIEAAMRRAAPNLDLAQVMEFAPKQTNALRQVLKIFAQVSRPGSAGRRPTSAQAQAEDRIYRPTFCRFLVDSQIVDLDAVAESKLAYHCALRHFDTVACGEQGPDGKLQTCGAAKSASIDQCVAIVSLLLGKMDLPAQQAWLAFEIGLEAAQRAAQMLLSESQRRASLMAKKAEEENSDEALNQRRLDLFNRFGSPPASFAGSVREWTRGLKMWMDELTSKSSPKISWQRCEQNFTLECFWRDCLLEPGCVHICLKYIGLFRRFYDAYRDQERMKRREAAPEEEPESEQGVQRADSRTPSLQRMVSKDFSRCSSKDFQFGAPDRVEAEREPPERVPHMSFAAFFRFCLDFSIFPTLVSFDEVRAAYNSVECGQLLEIKQALREKLKRAASKVSTILDDARDMFDSDMDEDGRSSPSSLVSSTQDDARSDSTRLSRRSAAQNKHNEKESAKPTVIVQRSRNPANAFEAQAGQPKLLRKQTSSRRSSSKSAQSAQSAQSGQSAQSVTQTKVFAKGSMNLRRGSGGNSQRVISKATEGSRSTSHLEVPGRHWPQQRPISKQAIQSMQSAPLLIERSVSKRFEHVADEEPTEPEEEPPRIKIINDHSWIKKPFAKMTPMERDAYGLMLSLLDCSADRFLCVRGLFAQVGEGDKQGLMDAVAVLRGLKALRIEHEYVDEREVQGFIDVVDPNSEGPLDSAELEKAMECVKEDRSRRTPFHGVTTGGGVRRVPLGDEARRLSGEVALHAGAVDEVAARESENEWYAFDHCAFVEAVLTLGLQHMWNDPSRAKSNAPGGLKCMWLIAYIHHQFDQSLLRFEGKKFQTDETLSQASTRPATGDTHKVRLDVDTYSQWKRQVSKDEVQWPLPEELLCRRARYSTRLECLIREHPDLFEKAEAEGEVPGSRRREAALSASRLPSNSSTSGSPAGGWKSCRRLGPSRMLRAPSSPSSPSKRRTEAPPQPGTECEDCGAKRNIIGIGDVFCHHCSGVDHQPLADSILYPVFQRRRLKYEVEARKKIENARQAAAGLVEATEALPAAQDALMAGHSTSPASIAARVQRH